MIMFLFADVEMTDGTHNQVIDCAIDQLNAQCSDHPEALKYFRDQLLRDPLVPQGVFIFLTASRSGSNAKL